MGAICAVGEKSKATAGGRKARRYKCECAEFTTSMEAATEAKAESKSRVEYTRARSGCGGLRRRVAGLLADSLSAAIDWRGGRH